MCRYEKATSILFHADLSRAEKLKRFNTEMYY